LTILNNNLIHKQLVLITRHSCGRYGPTWTPWSFGVDWTGPLPQCLYGYWSV